ncbi:hypothetical protein [Alicyclobacillus vulcanalis]|uniref:Uncharacterized protein n=1 Tax=Alicyclobacillus vulcanalis TaxID=252246 RepID=A0A1N7MWD2_9BACL|nr:hypothetical protein [Alicyclobacillus vulcanalis]SIS90251.1 hypothetical protein SAMN05421799_106164 [Alicyclobacillus vulcanalis]
MWETLILALICLILLAVLYGVSGAWKRHPGLKGFLRWTASQVRGGLQGSVRSHGPSGAWPRRPSEMARLRRADAQLAVQVLEELYEEWERERRALEARIRALEEAVAHAWVKREPARSPLADASGEQATEGPVAMEPNLAASQTSGNGSTKPTSEDEQGAAGSHRVGAWREPLDKPGEGELVIADQHEHASDASWPNASMSRERVYFSILDLLHEGLSDDEIEARLGVSKDEIALVEELLRMAERSKPGVH